MQNTLLTSRLPDVNNDISPDALRLLTALTLWDMPIAQNRLLDFISVLFSDSGLASGDKKYNANTIKPALSELENQGFVRQIPRSGFQSTPDIAHAILLHLHNENKLAPLIHATQSKLEKDREYTAWSTPSSSFCQREMLFAALNADLPKLGQWRSKFFSYQGSYDDLLAKKLFSTQAGSTLFAQLNSKVQGILLFDLFSAANWMLAECAAA